MVKGISRQVIVVNAPDPKLFEQAIFLLKDNLGDGVTNEALLKEATQVIRGAEVRQKKRHFYLYGAVWACAGAFLTGIVWLCTVLF